MATYHTTKEQAILYGIEKMGVANNGLPGNRLRHADDHAICQTYIDYYRIKKIQKYMLHFETLLIK